MLAEIITIGDEILIGQIVDTNSAWMAQQLNQIGIQLIQISSISDQSEAIVEALDLALKRADMVFITGGLGPTRDDVTKQTLADYFGMGLRLDDDTLRNIEQIFARLNRPMIKANIKQAEVPDACTVVPNPHGTAPGMWFEKAGKIIVSMPGVPFEMMYMMEEQVLPKLKNSLPLPHIQHFSILTAGIGESFLAQEIVDIENSLPTHITLAYLPKLGQVRLRLSASGWDAEKLNAEVGQYAQLIINRIEKYVVATTDIPFEQAILNLMEQKGLSLSTAESCTGGLIAHTFTQHPGASAVFQGAAVTYSNALKIKMLGVSEATLQEYGAVSEQTVVEMAKGAIINLATDYAIAVSGIAGPGGGTADKPVGTVWIAVANQATCKAKKFSFQGRRAQNIERAATASLSLLWLLLQEDLKESR
jgi:nicotinamide-nucleotide amidase